MTMSDQNDEWIAKQLSRAAERVRESSASTTANPDRKAATVDYSGLAGHGIAKRAMGLHGDQPMVAIECACGLQTGWHDNDLAARREHRTHADEASVHPLLKAFRSVQHPGFGALFTDDAKGVAAVCRWLADTPGWTTGHLSVPHALAALADEVEAAGTDNTTRSQ